MARRLNFTINIDDNDLCYLEEDIITESAKQLINEVMNNRYDSYGKTFREKLKTEIKEMMLKTMDTKFKDELKQELLKELENRYIKTRQYKEIKDSFDIDSDSIIKSGLKDIVSDIVNKELKNKFK